MTKPKTTRLPTWQLLYLSGLGGFTLLGPLVGGAVALSFAATNTPSTPEMAFVLMTAVIGSVLVGLALVPSVVFAGYLGFVAQDIGLASTLATVAIGIATFIGIGIFKRLSGSVAEAILAFRQQWLEEFHQLQKQHGRKLLTLIFFARLSPHMPFAATNLMIAQLKLPLAKSTIVSWLGLLPRSLFAVTLGANVIKIDELAKSAGLGWDGLATIIVVLLITIWAGKRYLLPKFRPSRDS